MTEADERELLKKVKELHENIGNHGHGFIILALIILLYRTCG